MNWEPVLAARKWVQDGEKRPGNPNFPSAGTFIEWVTELIDFMEATETFYDLDEEDDS